MTGDCDIFPPIFWPWLCAETESAMQVAEQLLCDVVVFLMTVAQLPRPKLAAHSLGVVVVVIVVVVVAHVKKDRF